MLAHYVPIGGVECNAMLALRLFGRVTPNGMDCGSGISGLDDAVITGGHSNGEILRSSHEAAATHALLSNNVPMVKPLLEGLATRMDQTLDALAKNQPPMYFEVVDLVKLIVSSANTGVPLTWREVAYVHQQIDLAHQTYLAAANDPVYTTFKGAPDGSWLYEPAGDGITFAFLGTLLGTCASQWRNPASKPILDCAKIKAWKPVY